MRGIVMCCVLKFACIESELGTEDSNSKQCKEERLQRVLSIMVPVHMHVTWLTRMADLGVGYHMPCKFSDVSLS
jgi:hypothetical protein